MQLGWPDYPWSMRSGRSDLEGGLYMSLLVSSSTWFNYVLDVPFLCLDRTLPIHRPQTINFSWKMHPRNLFSYVPSASFDWQTSWRTSSFGTSNFSSSAHLTKIFYACSTSWELSRSAPIPANPLQKFNKYTAHPDRFSATTWGHQVSRQSEVASPAHWSYC